MFNTCGKPRERLMFALCLSLCVGIVPALAEKKKDPVTAAAKDPRSGAALNRDAALSARAAGVAGGSPTQRRIALPAVNDPGADATAQDTQSETTVVDLGAGRLVAAFNDSGSFLGGGNHFTGYAFSSNNGLSWTDAGRLPDSAGGDAGDPVLAFKKAGPVYMATLEFSNLLNIQVFKSTDFGHTFAAPVNGSPGVAGQQDKPWMTVDNFVGGGNGNVYLCWTQFNPNGSIMFTRSTDSGATFGPSGGTLISTGGQGCFVVVSPNHQVNVFYYRGTGGGGQGGDNKIFMRRSTDLGVTFQPEVQVADLNTTTTNGNIGLLGGVRSNSFPHAAVNPVAARPFLYVVYNDIDPALPANKSDIYMVRSTDGGVTWSAPQRVNDDLAGDQFFPTVAIASGSKLMIGYYSRSHDANNLLFHRRGRLGSVAVNGVVTFNQSFQLSPDTPIAIGQDPVINATYMGDYDQIAAGSTVFSSTWADNRSGNAFHANQPDVHFAQIAASPAAADLAVTVTRSPANISLGQDVTFTVTAAATGGTATDVFLSMGEVKGLAIQSVNSPGGGCSNANGFFGCSIGSISAGNSKSIQVVATGVHTAATRKFTAVGTTSSADTNVANNTGSANVVVANGSAVTAARSTGNIAVPIIDVSTTNVPLTVPEAGIPVRIRAFVRLNHTFDSDLRLTLISPTGKTAILANRRGGSGDNYGTGTNDCAGTLTVFDDLSATPISAGIAPFSGTFKPEQPLSALFNDPMDGEWKLKIEDLLGGDTGTVGCFKLQITRVPD